MKYLIIIILIFSIISCNKLNESGIEIYQVQQLNTDFINQNQTDCNYCFKPQISDLNEKPLISEVDIEHFDWENQIITLTHTGN